MSSLSAVQLATGLSGMVFLLASTVPSFRAALLSPLGPFAAAAVALWLYERYTVEKGEIARKKSELLKVTRAA